ncbi:MAG: TlpA family protein disulfide reductase [bacterium]|nr:TlpA family protein disulfide reductase [bacterium]
MIPTLWTRFFLVLIVIGTFVGCEIVEPPSTPRGLLYVRAIDSLSGNSLNGLSILLDSVPQSQTTPALIGPIPAKSYHLTIRGLEYAERNYTVQVPSIDTLFFEAKMNRAPVGYIQVTSEPSNARIVIDEQYARDSVGTILVTPSFIPVSEGRHTVSAALADHRTLRPSLHHIEVSQNSTYPLHFQLEPAVVGRNVGNIPFPFRQEILQSDTTRHDSLDLEQYRGFLVMISCWFTTCNPCRLELPYFASTYLTYASRRVRFISPTTPIGQQSRLELYQSGQALGITYPLTYDPHPGFWFRMDGRTPPSYPLNILVDTTGTIVFTGGSLTENELHQLIENHLPR